MSQETERALLGALFQHPQAIDEVAMLVDSGDFTDRKHAILYQAVLAVYEKARYIEPRTVADALQAQGLLADAGGEAYILQVIATCEFPYSYKEYAESIATAAQKRALAHVGDGIKADTLKLSPDAVIDNATARLDAIRQGGNTSALVSFRELAERNLKVLDQRLEHPTEIIGLTCGLTEIDNILGGFVDGRTYVLLANTNMGKSTAAASIVAGLDCPGLVVTTESTPEAWIEKVVATMAHVPTNKIASGYLTEDEADRVRYAYSKLAARNSHCIADGSPTPQTVVGYLRSGIRMYGYQYLMVDSVNKIIVPKITEIYMISKTIADTFQEAARLYKVPIIQTCQAKPEVAQRNNKIPQTGDTVGGGVTAQDANVVISILRYQHYVELGVVAPNPDYPEDTALFVTIKNREGRKGVTTLKFIGGQGFYNRDDSI